MNDIDLELRILELEERNKDLKEEYDFIWEQYKKLANRLEIK
jgi:hypothetical protein